MTAGAPDWPAAAQQDAPVVVDLTGHVGVPSGAWEEPPRQALAIALADSAAPNRPGCSSPG